MTHGNLPSGNTIVIQELNEQFRRAAESAVADVVRAAEATSKRLDIRATIVGAQKGSGKFDILDRVAAKLILSAFQTLWGDGSASQQEIALVWLAHVLRRCSDGLTDIAGQALRLAIGFGAPPGSDES